MARKKTHRQLMAGRGQAADSDRARLAWWREARFGMFIHWGLYAVPAGVWKGERVPGLGEWIMYNGRIPVSEYEALAQAFDPVEFDARQWVSVAKDAGMRYLVITAKHHDGFSMFRSPSAPYNIADAAPFGRDPMAELAAACREAGIRLGFYYSQDQDWHDPDGAWNDWDYNEDAKDFDRYFRRKVVPQVTELLTQYGPIGLIWFDTPYTIDEARSRELRDLVHRLQPECLVSGRVGNDLGDYGSLGDNQIPVGRVVGDYETPATMNDTWGYRSDDENWKDADTLLYLLVDLASKGINYLLNVGPTAFGRIPEPSVERLRTIGEWLTVNGEAVYGTGPSPYPYELPFGRMTSRGDRLYVIFFTWPDHDFELFGLETEVIEARPLAEPGRRIGVERTVDEESGIVRLRLSSFGTAPQGRFPVVVLTLAGGPVADNLPLQQPDGSATLPAFMGEIHRADSRTTAAATPGAPTAMTVSRAGFTDEWHDSSAWIGWRLRIHRPGRFTVRVLSAAARRRETRVDDGPSPTHPPHEALVELSRDGEPIAAAAGPLTPDEAVDSPRAKHFPEAATNLGTVELRDPGVYDLALRATFIAPGTETGLAVSAVELRRPP